MVGTFLKTPTPHATEILASLGYDFVIVDAEHAPFDRGDIDMIAMAARGAGIAALVRVQSGSPSDILSCLDVGAAGVLVPHVDDEDRVREIAAACRYRNGGMRGYSTNSRAGAWGGVTMAQHMAAEDDRIACVAMIESGTAVTNIDKILSVAGLDAIFIGRADLTASLGFDRADSGEVVDATDRILAAASASGTPVMVLATSPKDAADLRKKGATAIVISSDQGFLRQAAADALRQYAPAAS